MPGCTAPWICYRWFTPLHRETTNEHCVEAAPCPHCHCRTDILQGVLTAPLGNYHCTSKAQSLKGQSCSKLMFTILHGLYISHSLPVCWSLCVSVALVKEWHVWLTKITAEMVCFTKCILQRKILRKMWCSYLCWNSPYYTNPGFLSPAFLCCLLWPLTILLYDEVWKELHSGLLYIHRSTSLSYWDNSGTLDSLM